MWFDDEDATGRRLARGSRKRTRRYARLGVTLKGRAARRGPLPLPAQWALFLLMAAGIVGLCGFLVYQAGQALFFRNPMFTLCQVDVRTGEGAFVSRSLIEEWIGEHDEHSIAEGMNLFAVNIGALRRDLLQKAPNFKSVDIERVLPDTLRMEIRERAPVAYVRQRRGDHLFLDDAGIAFVERRSRRAGLPHIVEYAGQELRPGHRGEGLLRDAIWAIVEFRRVFASDDLHLLRVSVRGRFEGRADSLRLILSNGVSVDIWWERKANGDFSPAPDLDRRLTHLAAIFRRADDDGIRLRSVNLTLDDYATNSPVTTR